MPYTYPTAAVDDRYLVTYVGTLNGQRIMSTFWYRLDTIFGAPDKGQIMDGMRAQLIVPNGHRQRYLEAAPANYTLKETWIQPIRPTRYVKKIYGDTLLGLWSQNADTSNVAAVIERRGVKASKKAVSVLHMPVSTNVNAMASGDITLAYKVTLIALSAQIESQLVLVGGHIVKPVIDNGTAVTAYNEVQSAFPQDTIRVMRRRTVGLGI